MKALISGANGFVGANVVSYFLAKGWSFDSIGRGKQNLDSVSDSYTWEELDKIDLGVYDVIIHTSGKAHDLKGTSQADEYDKVNHLLTKEFAQKSLEKGFRGDFVFLSSVKAVADIVNGEKLLETVVPEPKTPYGVSKMKGEAALNELFKEANANLLILRPCMIHGPGNKGNLNLLYQFVSKSIPYPLGVYKNKRSFLSVENLSFAIEGLVKKGKQGVYNLADSGELSTVEVVETIGEALSKSVKILNTPNWLITLIAKIGDVIPSPLNSQRLQKLTENYVVDNTKLVQEIGVLPIGIKEGMIRTIKSFNND